MIHPRLWWRWKVILSWWELILAIDLSSCLHQDLHLDLCHTEAAVTGKRSVSTWRTEWGDHTDLLNLEEIWAHLHALLAEEDSEINASKKRSLQVIRARIIPGSHLIGKKSAEVDFRKTYKAAIVAVRSGKDVQKSKLVTKSPFAAGEILVLQASNDSPLLIKLPAGFYEQLQEKIRHQQWSNSHFPVSNLMFMACSQTAQTTTAPPTTTIMLVSLPLVDPKTTHHPPVTTTGRRKVAWTWKMHAQWKQEIEIGWKDLEVLFANQGGEGNRTTKEFLTAITIAANFNLVGKCAMQLGFNKLPGLFLVSIERLEEQQQHQQQCDWGDTITDKRKFMLHGRDIEKALCSSEAAADISSCPVDDTTSSRGRSEQLTALTYEEPLQAGDLLWFSGSAAASHEKEELDKLNEKGSFDGVVMICCH